MHRAASLDVVRRTNPDVRVIAPARTKEALIAAVYLAVDAPDYARDNYDALADILRDLSWLPAGPVQVAWIISRAVPGGIRTQVQGILTEATRDSLRSARPLTVHVIEQGG